MREWRYWSLESRSSMARCDGSAVQIAALMMAYVRGELEHKVEMKESKKRVAMRSFSSQIVEFFFHNRNGLHLRSLSMGMPTSFRRI